MQNSIIDPKLLAIWIKSLRVCQHLSQEAVATSANIDVRSIQRAENGERVNLQTRRNIARGLGFKDIDVFDDPKAISEFTKFIQDLNNRAEQEHLEAIRKENPDALELQADKSTSAKELCDFSAGCEALHFSLAAGLSSESENVGAEMADWLRDYGDCASEMSHTQKLEFQREFHPFVDRLSEDGVSIFVASRKVRLSNTYAPEMKPFDWTIAYFHLANSPHDEVTLFVSKQVKM